VSVTNGYLDAASVRAGFARDQPRPAPRSRTSRSISSKLRPFVSGA
jgi:hypothetical protein